MFHKMYSNRFRITTIRRFFLRMVGRRTTIPMSMVFSNNRSYRFKKLIAQKDIQFSNSMVEAFNKTLKYRNLFPYEIRDYGSFVNHFEKCIPEYNNIRPHCAHKYFTSAQAYFGNTIDRIELRKRLIEARNPRILDNRNASCIVCDSKNSV